MQNFWAKPPRYLGQPGKPYINVLELGLLGEGRRAYKKTLDDYNADTRCIGSIFTNSYVKLRLYSLESKLGKRS